MPGSAPRTTTCSTTSAEVDARLLRRTRAHSAQLQAATAERCANRRRILRAGARRDEGRRHVPRGHARPDDVRLSRWRNGFNLGGTEFWQKWSGGHNPTYSFTEGTDAGRLCMQAAAIRFETIMKDPPAELVKLNADTNWGGSFFNWNDDYRAPTRSAMARARACGRGARPHQVDQPDQEGWQLPPPDARHGRAGRERVPPDRRRRTPARSRAARSAKTATLLDDDSYNLQAPRFGTATIPLLSTTFRSLKTFSPATNRKPPTPRVPFSATNPFLRRRSVLLATNRSPQPRKRYLPALGAFRRFSGHLFRVFVSVRPPDMPRPLD